MREAHLTSKSINKHDSLLSEISGLFSSIPTSGLFFHCLFHPCPVKSDFTLGTFSLVEVLFWKLVFFFFFLSTLIYLFGLTMRHTGSLGTQSPNHWTTREVPGRESWKSVLRLTEARLSRPLHVHFGLLALTYYPCKWYYNAVKTVQRQVLLSS